MGIDVTPFHFYDSRFNLTANTTLDEVFSLLIDRDGQKKKKKKKKDDAMVYKPSRSNCGLGVTLVRRDMLERKRNNWTLAIKEGLELNKNSSFGYQMLVQEFHCEIQGFGELSVFFVGGNVTHAIQKRPYAIVGNVIDAHSGEDNLYENLTDTERSLVIDMYNAIVEMKRDAILDASGGALVLPWVRLDMVLGNVGRWKLMEVTAMSADLWAHLRPAVYQIFAKTMHGIYQSKYCAIPPHSP